VDMCLPLQGTQIQRNADSQFWYSSSLTPLEPRSNCDQHLVISYPMKCKVIVSWCSWIRASWYNYENKQQDALYSLIYYSKSALHVSGDIFAHHQKHLTVFTVSGSVHPSCCRLVSRMSWNCYAEVKYSI